MMQIKFEIILIVVMALASILAASPDPLNSYNVIWDSPSIDSSGSMPIGNGDVGLNVWVEPDGDLLFYIGKTDAWTSRGDLFKVGRVRVKLSPNPFAKGLPFRQELDLRRGEIAIRAGKQGAAVRLRVWVDANHPVIHVEAEGEKKFAMHAAVELWGKNRFHQTSKDCVTWYIRNEHSDFVSRLKAHNLAGLEKTYPDPLRYRTFGGIMQAEGMAAVQADPTALTSKADKKNYDLQIHVLTAQTTTAQDWVKQVEDNIKTVENIGLADGLRAHRQWWNTFWNRSWIRLKPNGNADGSVEPSITKTAVPLRIGADDQGKQTLTGLVARVRLSNRSLSPNEIAASAKRDVGSAGSDGADVIGDWRFDRQRPKGFADKSRYGRWAKPSGKAEVIEHNGIKCVKGWTGRTGLR